MSKSSFLVALAALCLAPASLATPQNESSQGVVHEALADWREQHGTNWRVDVDEGTGFAEFLFGGSVAPDFTPVSEPDWFTLARGALGLAQGLHGIEQLTLVEHSTQYLPLGLVGSTDKMTVKFRQMVGGVPVDGGFVNVLFSAQGALLSVQTRALPNVAGVSTRAGYDADEAVERALSAFQRREGVPGDVEGQPELVIAQVDQAEARVPRLAWKVTVLWEMDDTETIGKTYFLDAISGEVVLTEEVIHHFDVGGTVFTKATPGTAPDTGTNPETQQPMRYARVQSSAGTTFTDANGNFNYPGATGPLSCTFTYVGTYNNVTNQAGAAYSLVTSLTGTGNTVILNPANDALTTSQANIFQSINIQRDWVRSVNPTDSKADFVHTGNANLSSTCNAFFNGSSINFYPAGGGCVATAYSTVVAHEDGHWLNVIYGTGNGSDGIGEGNADVWAMYIWDDPIVGLGFSGTGTQIRSGLNTTAFCGDANSGCYNGVHANGQPWMGAAWKVRRNLKNALGTVAGGNVANALFLGWMNSYNQTQIKSVIETQWLTLDDNDGNINNGTPHYAQIDAGFREQAFPGFDVIPVTITNVTQLPNTTNQSGPYNVSATMVSNFASNIASATLFYRAATSSAFTSVPMVNTSGDVWSAGIPGQIAPKQVQYYVRGTDGLGSSYNFPATAPTATLGFSVGAQVTVFCDNFETDLGWAINNTSVSTGAWQRAVPVGTTSGGSQVAPSTDNPGGTGTQCYVTQNGSAGGSASSTDLDGGPTVLTSPPMDLSVGLAEISYSYWLFNDDGDDSLVVQLATNPAGTNWVTARTYTGLDGGWATDTITVAAFVTPTATVRIRFSIADNPNNSLTEGAIDDVCASTLGPVGCQGDVTVYCAAKLSSTFCLPAIDADGIPSVSSGLPFDITASNVMNQKNGLLFYGYNTHSGVFQGGTMCVLAPLRRTPLQPTGGSLAGNDCSGTMTYDFKARILSGDDPLLLAGQFCAAQYYYRDPTDSFSTGLTNAVSFTICP